MTDQEAPIKRPLIFVLDHEPAYLRLMQTLLNGEGFGVLASESSGTAYEQISALRPDLVLLDTWIETREAGWTVLQTMLLDPATADTPVLITSSDKEGFEERAEALEGRRIQVVYKPYNTDTLVRTIRDLIGPASTAK
jgi:CheY-like chemotaxis protein